MLYGQHKTNPCYSTKMSINKIVSSYVGFRADLFPIQFYGLKRFSLYRPILFVAFQRNGGPSKISYFRVIELIVLTFLAFA